MLHSKSAAGGTEVELEPPSARITGPSHEHFLEPLAELVRSIAEHGILRPAVVEPSGDGYSLAAATGGPRGARGRVREIPVLARETGEDRVSFALRPVPRQGRRRPRKPGGRRTSRALPASLRRRDSFPGLLLHAARSTGR
jgi:hypothetical protein